jgi:hypothetical protein
MDNPEYIIVEAVKEVVDIVATVLNKNINYQYGFVEELNETLEQFNSDPTLSDKLFPLVWLQTPFAVRRGEPGFYGTADNLNIYIINSCDVNWKAAERMQNNYKPILYPIYRELLKQLSYHTAFSNTASSGNTASNPDLIPHRKIDYFYWGEQQRSYLAYPVDMLQLQQIILKVNHNQNCQPLKSFV